MKTLIVFYSYTGNTKRLAQSFAAKENADVLEIADVRRPGKLKAYSLGCFAAMSGKAWPIQPPERDFAVYDRLILFSPVWAGNPPPAVHAFLKELPKGKAVFVKMVSASGKSNCREKLEAAIKARGCSPEGFEDIKG